ncbi:S8 family serine peptidase [Saccharothrix coeruleofusca]|uniref:Peptidase n=1 Tax=Saccharothrix coeruleofusca TaxID=33919 RepID=A0A918EFR7_9PSEU|nr:S8 family serine peptidase [Saccharothrix coeruleofusca]GGP75390.1 peptidase [Saccharothrix coeruleofusca]
MRLLAVAALVAAATTAPLGAGSAGAVPAQGARTGTDGQWVTLVTGHRVLASRTAQGRWSVLTEPSRDGRATAFLQYGKRRGAETDLYVLPAEAVALVRAGVLDAELFNVSGLIRQRYDDARSDTVPLLVEYPDAAVATAPPGAAVERQIPDLRLAAVAEHKVDARHFWSAVTGGGTSGARLAGGPTRIWLNARVEAALDASVPQVGAPAAWQNGLTGQDVTVAVLDTGYDERHPDLADRVTTSRDFSGKGNASDGDGHGTHVASTIAGSGAASGGRYKGVAPGAKLAVGKVLDDSGSGQLDDVIAGMRWAAAETGAKVVNLSLGTGPTDGTDPVAQAVNTLSARHGTLFVAAAGNSGSPESVGSPAAADAALAVGSVTKSGALSDFSSRGPRLTDGAVKPEIAAPGSDIVAARAGQGRIGEPVDEHHTRLSGTSMATPHVAGAAAILAQQHPDWTGDQLKAALVGTAAPVAGAGVLAVGGGLLDVARATTQRANASPAAVNAYLAWPDTQPQRRAVTYTNTATTPLTLALELDLADGDGKASPAGLAALSASSVTVPAGGVAEVELILTPRSGAPGVHSGVLTATSADGAVRLRTPVGVHDEPEKHDLTLSVRNRDGAQPAPQDSAVVMVTDVDSGEVWFGQVPSTTRLPAGRYSVMGSVETPRPDAPPATSTFVDPDVRLSSDTEIVFDAREGQRVSRTTDQPAARGGVQTTRLQTSTANPERPSTSFVVMSDPRFSELYAQSARREPAPWFGYADNLRLEEPGLELFAEQPQRFEVPANWLRGSPEPTGTQRLAAVHGGQGTPEDLAGIDAHGKLVVLELPGELTYEEVYRRIRAVKDAGGKAVAVGVLERTALAAALDDESPAALPTLHVHDKPGQRFADLVRAGGVTASYTARTASAHRYELSYPSQGQLPPRLTTVARTADLAAVRMAYHGGTPEEPPTASAWVEALGGRIGTQWSLPVPPHAERVEHFTPGRWHVEVGGWWAASGRAREVMTLEGGKSYRMRWHAAVAAPRFTGTTSNELGEDHPWAWRVGNKLDITVPFFTDADGHARAAEPFFGYDRGSTALHRDGRVVGTQDQPGIAVFAVPDGEAEYRLTADVSREQPWWPLSTKVSGSWTFRSGFRQGPGRPLPLLSVGFAPAVDLGNAAPAGPFSFPVALHRQDAVPSAESVELEVSFDDGGTWAPVPLSRDGERWTATVTNPDSGFASLRAKAADTEGNAVEQTVIRAYRIG